MNIKELLFSDSELNIESLVQLHSGSIVDVDDMLVTQDGMSWRDARHSERSEVYAVLSKESYIDHSMNYEDDECGIDDDRPDIRNDNGYIQDYKIDTLVEGVGNGFRL